MKPRINEHTVVDGSAGQIEVVVTDPGEVRRGYAIVAHPHPLYGGTLDNKVVQTLAKAFHTLGYAAVRFNFRGVGKSEGVFDDGIGELEDLIAVDRFAGERFGETDRVLAGFSFGSFVSAAAAEKLDVRHLVLVAPAVGRFAVGTVPANALVIHGEEDGVVPLSEVMDWARPQQLPVVVIPGTGHFFHGMLITLQKLVSRFCSD